MFEIMSHNLTHQAKWVKTTLRFLYPSRVTKIRKWKYICISIRNKCAVSSKKLKVDLPCDPYLANLDIFSRNSLSYYKDACSSMFIAVLFTKVRTWNQASCPFADEWMRNTVRLHSGISFHSSIKNGIMKFTDKWKELNNYLFLTEMVQTMRDKSSIFSFRCWVLA